MSTIQIHPDRLRPKSKRWLLTAAEQLQASVPSTVLDEQLLQTVQRLTFADQRAVLADALARSIQPRNSGAPA